MKSALIYYFSGTGNTEKVIYMLKQYLEEMSCLVKLMAVDDKKNRVEISHSQIIGLAYPIYGFGTPEIIDRFVDELPDGEGRPLFLLKTGADFISINHNASSQLICRLEHKGYKVFYDRIIAMPSNWLVSYNDDISKQLFESARKKTKQMSLEVLSLTSRRFRTSVFLRKLSMAIASMEKKYLGPYFGKSLYAGKMCNLCGICVENCPYSNIRLVDKKISFSSNCLSCMRCVYNCPQNALKSKCLNFLILKKGYNLNRIINNDLINADYINSATRGYFRHFYKYLSDDSL